MKANQRKQTTGLVFNLTEIPFEGLEVSTSESFSQLWSEKERNEKEEMVDLLASFQHPVKIEATLTPVGAKIDLRGHFFSKVSGECDRCNDPVNVEIDGDFSMFLMPAQQFSEHDKPGGKVIHGKRDDKPSRHHSRSKAEKLSDAAGEHEDLNFGAYDGEKIDLRPIIREHMILEIPIRTLCSESCKGLCLRCTANLNVGLCKCKEGPLAVEYEEVAVEIKEPLSPLAQALKAKLQTGS